VDGVDYYGCDVGAAKVQRTCAGVVEKPVHRHEGLSGGARRRESAIRREAAVQAPGDEDGLPDGVVVRQAATERWPRRKSGRGGGKFSGNARRPIDNRPQINNLPHKSAAVCFGEWNRR
jgi:hypothetical protein